jgi:hypothetical protein
MQLPLPLHRTRLSHVQIIHTHTRIHLKDTRAVFAFAVLLRFAEEGTFKRQCTRPSFGRLQLFRRFKIFALKSPEIMNHSTSFLEWHVFSVSLDIASHLAWLARMQLTTQLHYNLPFFPLRVSFQLHCNLYDISLQSHDAFLQVAS